MLRQLRFLLAAPTLLLLVFGLVSSASATCTITSDANPPLVASGATHSFAASCGSGLTWSVTGSGSIDPSTGVYTAPSSRAYGVYDRGAQLQPQNAAWNVPIDGLSVHAQSATWMGRVYQYVYNPLGTPFVYLGHQLMLIPGDFYNTVVDSSSPQQFITCFYNCGGQTGNYRIPPTSTILRQLGWHMDPIRDNLDNHLFTVNKNTGENQEVYQLTMTGTDAATSIVSDGGSRTLVTFTNADPWLFYSPLTVGVFGATGSWTGFNTGANPVQATVVAQAGGSVTLSLPFDSHTFGAAPAGIHVGPFIQVGGGLGTGTSGLINAEGASKWSPGTNAIPAGNGSDAPGSNIDATSLHMDELNDALVQGRSDIGHLLRTTLTNGAISARDLWPSINGSGVIFGHAILSVTATNAANPAQLTLSSTIAAYSPCTDLTQGANYSIGYTVGCTFPVTVTGYSGGCTGLNGNWTATAVNATHVTIPVLGCGAITGAPKLQNNWMPYGTRLRYKSTGTSAATICAAQGLSGGSDACKLIGIIIATFKKYGLMMLDGTVPGDNWDSGVVSSEYMTDAEAVALKAMTAYFQAVSSAGQNFDQQLEVVDASGIQLTTDNTSVNWMGSTENEVTVTVTGSGGTASLDVLLQGTTVGIFPQRLTVAQGSTYQLAPWVTGNASSSVTYAVSPSISGLTVSGTGLVTVGAVASLQTTTVTICHTIVTTACTYLTLDVLPVSSDSSYRVAFGQLSPYFLDSGSFKWWNYDAAATSRNWGNTFSNPVVGTMMSFGSYQFQTSSWNAWANADRQLYGRSAAGNYDILGRIALPSGTYLMTFLGEPGCSVASPSLCSLTPGTNVSDVEVQGVTVTPNQDAYVLPALGPGTYSGYSFTVPATVAADGILEFAYRGRALSTYGISLSALMVTPSGSAAPAKIFGAVLNGVTTH